MIKILVWCERVLTVYNRRRTLPDADGVVYYFELCPRASSPLRALWPRRIFRLRVTRCVYNAFLCRYFAIDDIENVTTAFWTPLCTLRLVDYTTRVQLCRGDFQLRSDINRLRGHSICIQQHTTEFGIYGIYGLVIDKYTITEYATTAARGDFPLRHSSQWGLCALSSESGGCLIVAAGWVFLSFTAAVRPSVRPSQVGILADNRHDVGSY